jgi:predicted transcriptional regulator
MGNSKVPIFSMCTKCPVLRGKGKKGRIDKGLKQKDLMALTGLTQKHLSLIENDDVDPGVSVLRKIVLD